MILSALTMVDSILDLEDDIGMKFGSLGSAMMKSQIWDFIMADPNEPQIPPPLRVYNRAGEANRPQGWILVCFLFRGFPKRFGGTLLTVNFN
jgi:hypothetical protein